MLSREELRAFEEIGAVTIDSPFTTAQLDAAAAAIDRLFPERTAEMRERDLQRASASLTFFDPELLELLQHPFLEDCARGALAAEEVGVRFFQTTTIKSFPDPGSPFSFWEHVDAIYRLEDLQATPRRMLCHCFIWLTDVTPDRAPMMYRPGSHRLLAAQAERDPALITRATAASAEFRDLPALPYAEPQPLLARRGQVSVLSTALVHGASRNIGTSDRKMLTAAFAPRGVEPRVNTARAEQRSEYHRELRSRFRPERRHLVAIEA